MPGSEYEEARIEYTMKFFSTLVPVRVYIEGKDKQMLDYAHTVSHGGISDRRIIGFLHDISGRYSAVLLNEFGSFLWLKEIITQETKLGIDFPYYEPILNNREKAFVYPYITVTESDSYHTIHELINMYNKELK